MNFRLLAAACPLLLIPACEEKKEVTITETRPLTTKDAAPRLNATDDERFRDARPSPVKGETPASWQPAAPSQFRLLNYRFGTTGEVWVSLSAGGLTENVNRWLRQFGAAEIDEAGVAKLRKVSIAGSEGVWVEAEGEYVPGMGQSTRANQALAGVIATIDGRIVTVKMVGPKAEVDEQKAVLETYARDLKLAD